MMHTNHLAEEAVQNQMYDLVIYGHTHQRGIRRAGRTLVINPGEATDWITGAARAVILDLRDMSHTAEPLG